MNGASADPCVTTIRRLSNSSTSAIGASQYFLRTRRNCQNSSKI